MQFHEQRSSGRKGLVRSQVPRRGIAKLWLILLLPCIVIGLCLVIEVANLWIARAELENALEAAALAAVKEWGDAGGGDTELSREIGLEFAAANVVRRQSVDLDKNYLASSSPNQNAQCINLLQRPPSPPAKGILIFGSITDSETPHTFDATSTPGCGDVDVLLDVSKQGNTGGMGRPGSTGSSDAWGVSFLMHSNTNPNIRITRIEIDLQAAPGTTGRFDLNGGPPMLANPMGTKVEDGSAGNSQPNISGRVLTADGMGPPFPSPASPTVMLDRDPGFPNPASQITFSPTTGTPTVLTITFSGSGMDDGFAPGDRFRFGVDTTGVGSGNSSDDGDGIGEDAVQATIYYRIGSGPEQSVTATFVNNTDSKNDCLNPALVDPLSGSLIVHPQGIPDLPCPPSAASNNNGQSYARTFGSGQGDEFAVHAVGSVFVPSIYQNLFRLMNVQFSVSARATAMYDCEDQEPRLIRIDELICQ